MDLKTILLTESEGIATITLNRPERRNAISYQLIDELLRALAAVERSPAARVVILTGAGKAFCAGMDLDDLKGLLGRSPEDSLKDTETMARLFRGLYDFPKPTIAAVNGAAMGGGCGLASVCDFAVASDEAKFAYTEVRIGFVPAIVATFLVRQVGERHARDLLLTGRTIDAEEAKRLGLVTDIIAGEQLMEWARELAGTLMQNSPASLRATKGLISGLNREAFEHDLRHAVEENARVRATPDFREGITSFLEKRKPRWGGD